MSFDFDYQIFYDSEDDVHEEKCDGDGYEFGDCVCENLTKKITISFTTSCGSNLEYVFESIVTFFMNKNDKKNLKMFIEILKNPEKINDLINNANQTDANDDQIYLSRNRRLYYNSKYEIITINLDSSRYNHNTFKFNLNTEEIVFGLSDTQCCGHFCGCGDCEYYGRFDPSLEILVPFKTETKLKIIEAFKDVCDCLE